ncbi:kinase-regulated stress-responsive transcription factor skn7 [Rhodotorula toruloides]
MDDHDPSSHPHPHAHTQPTDPHTHDPPFSPADPPGPPPHPHSLGPASPHMQHLHQRAHSTGEGDASAEERDEGVATLERQEDPLASAQEDSVGVEYGQEKLAQSTSAPATPSLTFPPLPNWAQLQASVSSPPKPAEGGEGGGGRRKSLADFGEGEGAGVGEEERGRTIFSVRVPPASTGEEGVAKVPIPTGGGGEGGGGQGGSRPTLTDYCVRDLALEAVRQAHIAEQEDAGEAKAGEKRARSSSEDAEGEEDTEVDSPLAQRRRTDYASTSAAAAPAYAPQHPFAYPYQPQQASYIHGLPHFSPPFTSSGGYQSYNPHSPICPPPPASTTTTTQAGRAVWGLASTSAMALGAYGSSSSAPAWRYDPNQALQQQQLLRGAYGGYQGSFLSPIPSVPPLQPPVLPPIQGYSDARPSPARQESAAYDSEDEEASQRFESASSPATTRTSIGVGSPATSIATPRAAPRQPKEEGKEVPLVSGEGGAVKLDQQPPQQQAQQLVPIAPAPAPPQQQDVAQEAGGAAGGGETKRKGGRGVTPKNAFAIDPIQGVKPFIVKLRWLLVHPEIAGDVVCWSEDGHSVLVKVGGDTSRLTDDILPRTFAHSNIAAFQHGRACWVEKSYGFTSLKGADLTAALEHPAPPTASTSTSTPHLPAFGPSSAPAPTRDPKEWRAYTHLHTPSDAALARQAEAGGEEWQDEEWWFERDGMEDLVCLGRLKAKGKAKEKGGAKRSSTAGSAGGTQRAGESVVQVQGGATAQAQAQGQGQSGVQGLLASFKLPANDGRGGT